MRAVLHRGILGLLGVIVLMAMLGIGYIGFRNIPIAHAAAVITVNSTADTTIDDGECTLREAIAAANTDLASGATPGECVAGSGADTIAFNIAGAGVHTIQPTSALPQVTETVTIDGTTQPGWVVNSAVAPQPFNGTMVIQLDGQNNGSTSSSSVQGLEFNPGSENSVVKGLVINNFSEGSAIVLHAAGIAVQGNYIGTDPTGMSARPNEVGVNGEAGTHGENALIGGLSPSDRNIISGNTAGNTANASYPASGWVIRGNYVGVGTDGLTAIPNARVGGSGAFSIDGNQDVIVGGLQAGATNVISGNYSHGIAPDNSNNLMIIGNYIGVGYDGTTVVTNASGGPGSSINLGNSADSTIKNNIIASDHTGSVSGIYISNNTTTQVINNSIFGNSLYGIQGNDATEGLQIKGNTITQNSIAGIYFNSTTASSIGGINASDRNFIYGNGATGNPSGNIVLSSFSLVGLVSNNITVQGNYIGVDNSGIINQSITSTQGPGIILIGDITSCLIGGEGSGAANLIAGNRGAGIGVEQVYINAFATAVSPTNNAIIGNSIYGNVPSSIIPTSGLGVDLFKGIDTDGTPDGIPNTYVGEGINPQAPAGNVPGEANDYINHPVINSASFSGTHGMVSFDLNAAGSPGNTYHVEFFANDDSTAGQGKTYLGFANVSPGTNLNSTSLIAPDGFSPVGKYIMATATEYDSSFTATSGYGSTSEFSPAIAIDVVSSGELTLAKTGANEYLPLLQGSALLLIAALSLVARRRLLAHYIVR